MGGGDLIEDRAEDGVLTPEELDVGRLGSWGGTVWFLRVRAFSRSSVIVGGSITGELEAVTFS